MEQLQIRAHQTIRLGLNFGEAMTGHILSMPTLFKINAATIQWLDEATGEAELLIASTETAKWPLKSRHHLSIATTAPNGDVEVWGTIEFKVIS